MDMIEVEDMMVALLNINREDAKVYILLVSRGAMGIKDIADALRISRDAVKDALSRLLEYGACIELNGRYEALNPKFAVTNMYRMMCISKGIAVKRMQEIDSIANILASVYERGRV